MEKCERELDVIALMLTNVTDLLSCFLDYCENEGKLDENLTSEEVKMSAWCFLVGMQKQKSLIEAAYYTVKREAEIVYSLFDEQEAGVTQ